MTTLSEIDLTNRIPFLKIKSRKKGSLIFVSVTVAGKLIAKKRAATTGGAVKNLRSNLLSEANPVFLVTQGQKRKLRELIDGDTIFNTTLQKLETYIDGNWV